MTTTTRRRRTAAETAAAADVAATAAVAAANVAPAAPAPEADTPEKLAERLVTSPACLYGAKVSAADEGDREDFTAIFGAKSDDELKALRLEMWTGYVAHRLHLNRASTAITAAMVLVAASALGKEGKDRTDAEKRAYDGARQAWSRKLKYLNVATPDKRGGANNPGKPADKAKTPAAPAGDAGLPVVPDASTASKYTHPREGSQYLNGIADTMNAVIAKAPAGFDTQMLDIVNKFTRAIRAHIVAQ